MYGNVPEEPEELRRRYAAVLTWGEFMEYHIYKGVSRALKECPVLRFK
jgi:hypothetical protein